jgi:ribosomal protein L37AE/L43A
MSGPWPEHPCPKCNGPATALLSTTNPYQWNCEKCDIRYDDQGNQPEPAGAAQ